MEQDDTDIGRDVDLSRVDRGLRAHGPEYVEDFEAMWDLQGGRCYLCADPLFRGAVIDHDHACCPAGKSCRRCRRGLACQRCNRLIGMVHDQPALLRRIADNLDARMARGGVLMSAAEVAADLTPISGSNDVDLPPLMDVTATFQRQEAVLVFRQYLAALAPDKRFAPRDLYGVLCTSLNRSPSWLRSEMRTLAESGFLVCDEAGEYRVTGADGADRPMPSVPA